MKIFLPVAAAALLLSTSARALPVYEPFADATANGGTSYAVQANLT